MGTSLRNKIWEQTQVDGGKLLVLMAMADHGDEWGDNISAFMQEFADAARLSLVHTRRLVHALCDEGYITLLAEGGWHNGICMGNEYRMMLDRVLPYDRDTLQDERVYGENLTQTPHESNSPKPPSPPPDRGVPAKDSPSPKRPSPPSGRHTLTDDRGHDRDYPSAEHRGYTGERRAPEPPAAHTCIRAENDIYLFNSQDQDLDQEKKINTYSGSAIAIRACEEASPSQDDQDEEDEDFAASVELLTHEDVGLNLSFAQDAAKIYSFKFLVKQVFAWLDGRAKGSKYNTTGALRARIEREFNAPALTNLQENSRLFKQFCRKDYSGADFVPLKRKQYNIDGELLADTPYEYPIIGGRYQA